MKLDSQKQYGEKALKKIQENFKDSIIEAVQFRREMQILVKKENLTEIMKFLKEDLELTYNFLVDLTAVDRSLLDDEHRFEVVYHLHSFKTKDRLSIKIPVEEDCLSAPSISSIWGTANWQEREVYDLFGIKFNNHPDLRRILLWDGFDGHPLQKDYPLEGKGERENFDIGFQDNLKNFKWS